MQSLYNQPITICNALNFGKSKLDSAGIRSSALEARLLLELAGYTKHDDFVHRDVLQKFLDLIEQRAKRVPIAHLLGKREFYSIEFAVNSDVLIPRPDSEVLIDEALMHFDKNSEIKILDLGVGSGCLLLTLLNHFPKASGVGVDISEQAIATARHNYNKLGLKNCVEFLAQDWNVLSLAKTFDLILSNPPYIASSYINELDDDVKLYEPHIALDGGQDGLKCYREILPIITSLLNENGIALLECGFDQNERLTEFAFNHNLQVEKTLYDLSGIKRGLCLRRKI